MTPFCPPRDAQGTPRLPIATKRMTKEVPEMSQGTEKSEKSENRDTLIWWFGYIYTLRRGSGPALHGKIVILTHITGENDY